MKGKISWSMVGELVFWLAVLGWPNELNAEEYD